MVDVSLCSEAGLVPASETVPHMGGPFRYETITGLKIVNQETGRQET